MPRRDFSRNLRWMRESTDQRRAARSKRKRTFTLVSIGFVALILVGLPSFLCFTPVVHSMLASRAAAVGWDVRAQTIGIGWITPLQLRGVEAVGGSGATHLKIPKVDTEITILDLLRGRRDWGVIHLDQPELQSRVRAGGSALEEDLRKLLSGDSSEPWRGQLALHNGVIELSDEPGNRRWRADQLQADVELATGTRVDLEAVLTAHDGISGALEAELILPETSPRIAAESAHASVPTLRTSLRGLPLSMLELLTLRAPQWAQPLPQQWSGNATGELAASWTPGGSLSLSSELLDLRNLLVLDPAITGPQAWKIGQATLRGETRLADGQVDCRGVALQSDAGNVRIEGSLALEKLREGDWMRAFRGQFHSDVDLAVLTQSAPGLVPVRTDARIERGRVATQILGGFDRDGRYRSQWDLQTQSIRAVTARGQRVVIEPVSASCLLRPGEVLPVAEQLHVASSFGWADASGDLRSGDVRFDVDFGKLSQLFDRVFELPRTTLSGTARGQARWAAAEGGRWSLTGNASGRGLVFQWDGGPRLERPRVDCEVAAEGIWSGGTLQQLTSATLALEEPHQNWRATLLEPVAHPSVDSELPLELRGNGELAEVIALLGAWLPATLESASGQLDATLVGSFGLDHGQLRRSTIRVRSLDLEAAGYRWRQAAVNTEFSGSARYPSAEIDCRQLQVSGNAVALAAQGKIGRDAAALELAYRCDWAQLQSSLEARGQRSTSAAAITESAFAPAAPWLLFGSAEGQAQIARSAGREWQVAIDASCVDLQLLRADDLRPLSNLARAPTTDARQAFWAESHLDVDADLRVSPAGERVVCDRLQLSAPWMVADLRGELRRLREGYQLQVDGPLELQTSTLARRLTQITGQQLTMRGRHRDNLHLLVRAGDGQPARMELDTALSWDAAEFAGVKFGQTSLPISGNETLISLGKTVLPLEQGRIHLAGDLHYAAAEPWFEQAPGLFAEGVKLTPEMCRGWMRYVMPLAAGTTDVRGQFSVQLDRCVVSLKQPRQSRVRGTLRVENASLGPAPLTQSLLAAVDSLRSAARGVAGGGPVEDDTVQWVRLPAQPIDFALGEGRVSHQRMMMQAGKVQLLSSGSVSLDGRLGLAIEIPLLPAWLGSDLSSLAGQQLTVPIGGSFQRPQVDSSAVAQTIGNLAGQAVRDTAENYLQRQLDRQMQRLGELIGPLPQWP